MPLLTILQFIKHLNTLLKFNNYLYFIGCFPNTPLPNFNYYVYPRLNPIIRIIQTQKHSILNPCKNLTSISYPTIISIINWLVMIKICTRLLRYAIAVPRIDITRKNMLKQTKIDFVSFSLTSFPSSATSNKNLELVFSTNPPIKM
jgi:hypothetical protein